MLKGVIRDEDNSENLSYSVVKLLSPERIIQCSEKGEFTIEGLCEANYSLLVKHAGCRDTVFTFELRKSKKMVFKLPHSLNALEDVEVYGEHKDTEPTQAVESLSMKDLDRTKGAGLGDQLKQLNGVNTMNTGATIAKPIINGMQGYRILILNNGIRQEGQQWGNEHAPEIDPFVAQKLSVIRGAAAVRYGSDAIGGVVLVEPGDLPDTASVSGEYNLTGSSNGRGGATSLQVQGYLDKVRYFSWRVQGTLKRSGTVHTPDYFLKNTALGEQNFSTALEYHRKKAGVSIYYSQFNSKVGIFSGAHIGNLTDLEAAFKRSKPQDSLAGFSYEIGRPYQNIKHELFKLSSDFHTGPRSRVYFNYAFQNNLRQEYDKHVPRNDEEAVKNLPELDYRIATQTGELTWEHNYIKSFRGKFGSQAMYQENVYTGRFFIPNYANKTIGFFAIERFVRPTYELEAGVRQDYKDLKSFFYNGNDLQTPHLKFSNTSFNLGGIYKVDSLLKVSFNLANGWRSPAVNELYSNGLHHGVGAIERGDANLKMEKCNTAILSALVTKKRLTANITAYTYEFSNYIYFEPAGKPELTIRGAYPVFNYTQHNANISGADALIAYRINKVISLKGRAMWVRGWNRELKQHLIYMPADRYELMLPISLKNTRYFKNTYIEPGFNYVARQTKLPLVLDFAPAPEAYHLLALNASTTFKIHRQEFILTLSVNNAANTIYRDYLDRFRYFNDAQGRNITFRLRMPLNIYDKQLKS